MIDLIQKKVEMLDWKAPALKCDQQKRKRNMENKVWEYTVQSKDIVYEKNMKTTLYVC